MVTYICYGYIIFVIVCYSTVDVWCLLADHIAVDNMPFTVATITVGRLMKWYYDKDGLGELTKPRAKSSNPVDNTSSSPYNTVHQQTGPHWPYASNHRARGHWKPLWISAWCKNIVERCKFFFLLFFISAYFYKDLFYLAPIWHIVCIRLLPMLNNRNEIYSIKV